MTPVARQSLRNGTCWRGITQFYLPPTRLFIMEWASLHSFRKLSPDRVARARQRTFGSAYYSSIDLERMKGCVGLVGWPYTGWFTHKWSPISYRSSVGWKVRRPKTGVLKCTSICTRIMQSASNALRHGSYSFNCKLHHACLYSPATEHHCPLAGTHFTVPRRVEGWVDLGGGLHTKIKYCLRELNPDTSPIPVLTGLDVE